MDVPRDPLGRLLGGLALLTGASNVELRLNPSAGENMRWICKAGDEQPGGTGNTALEAITSAYRGVVHDLEGAAQRLAGELTP